MRTDCRNKFKWTNLIVDFKVKFVLTMLCKRINEGEIEIGGFRDGTKQNLGRTITPHTIFEV